MKKQVGIPFKKGERPVGRAKGTPNRLTVTLRAVFEQTFLELQKRKRKRGPDGKTTDGMPAVALLDWAQENPGEFYKLAARMVPHEIAGPGGGPIPFGMTGSVTVYIPDNGRAVKPGNGGGARRGNGHGGGA